MPKKAPNTIVCACIFMVDDPKFFMAAHIPAVIPGKNPDCNPRIHFRRCRNSYLINGSSYSFVAQSKSPVLGLFIVFGFGHLSFMSILMV